MEYEDIRRDLDEIVQAANSTATSVRAIEELLRRQMGDDETLELLRSIDHHLENSGGYFERLESIMSEIALRLSRVEDQLEDRG